MASIQWMGWATSNGGAAAGSTSYANAIILSSASALSFGSGARNSFQANITINSWNTSMHWAKNTAQSSIDYCGSVSRCHLMAAYPVSGFVSGGTRSTAVMLSTGPGNSQIYRKMVAGSPMYKHGMSLYFTHGVPVYTNPAYLWVGTNTAVDGYPYNSQWAMADLTSSQPRWYTVNPNGKLALRIHGATSQTIHQWCFMVAVRPDAVGFNDRNFIKTQITYY